MRVISNFGVGVDHIDVRRDRRGIPVGNTPGILDGHRRSRVRAILAAGRAWSRATAMRAAGFHAHDPSFMLGREVHGSMLGIFGMGRIGRKWPSANGFGMTVLPQPQSKRRGGSRAEGEVRDEGRVARERGYVVLTVPLTAQHAVHRSGGNCEMKQSATL